MFYRTLKIFYAQNFTQTNKNTLGVLSFYATSKQDSDSDFTCIFKSKFVENAFPLNELI